jgi:peptide/nickel transport system permease protein
MRALAKILVHRIGALAVTLVAGGLLTAVLVRVSPGFDSDERQLDPRLNQASRISIAQERGANRNILGFYAHRLERIALHGDLGKSESLQRPIAQLLRERLPVTAEIMALGVIGGWALAFALALPAAICRSPLFRGLAGLSQQALMCLPAAALAIVIFDIGGPVRGLVALVVCPRVFEYLRNLLLEAYAQPHIVTARAKGLGGAAIFSRHVMPYIAPQLLALAGVSVSMAFGAAIPIEALCDLPGIGQLAWLAATARDLPLLLAITLLVIATTQVCNAMSDWAALHGRQA